jgi:predicted extracellular nuclease
VGLCCAGLSAGVHFKAIPTQPSSCAQREAQATVIAHMVADDLTAGREVVVTGDFNDFSGEEADRDVQGKVRTSVISFKPFNLGQEAGSHGRTAHGTGAD